MAYKAFSDPKNIDKMVRNIEVWPEQETLETALFQNQETPYQNLGHWVKYVSTGSPNKLQVYLYWDTKIEDKFLARVEKRLLKDSCYFNNLDKKFLIYYRRFDLFTRRLKKRPVRYYQNLSKKKMSELFQTFTSYSRPALIGYYIVYDITNLLLRLVKKELSNQSIGSEELFEELCTVGIYSELGGKSNKKEKQRVINLLKPLKQYPDIYSHTVWLRKMMGYRNREAVAIHAHYEQATKFFNELSCRLNISLNDFWYLSKEEIVGGLREKINIESIIAKRKIEGFTIKQVGKKIKVLTGVKPEDWHEAALPINNKEIKGNAAFIGKIIKGKVQIVFDPALARMEIGDILVTPMTTPNFVPLMKKARAIITDEGGLLCHASIVARELKKPCIVGTKFATQVLEDGDKIEIDIKSGTVKIQSDIIINNKKI